MAETQVSIRVDLESGGRIGPGKIALLEAIRETGSITAAAVNRTHSTMLWPLCRGRTHGRTDQYCIREESPCQLGAVHTWPFSTGLAGR
jgi:hypothetical protein